MNLMFSLMKVSKSGYHEWLHRLPSKRQQANNELTKKICLIHKESRETYGGNRIYAELCDQGISCGKNRVVRLKRKAGIMAKTRRRFKVTTDSKHDLPISDNILNREFNVLAPNTHWAVDISYVPTWEGWLYLAVVIDLFSRKVVGWSMAGNMKTGLVKSALLMALKGRKIPKGLVHHSDRGSQYASFEYQTLLSSHHMVSSMSRRGNCWDNAVVESFFHTLKTELIYHCKYKTREEAEQSIFEYIEIFYNRKRRHSTLGYQSPEKYEMMALAA
jgi:putative transposase